LKVPTFLALIGSAAAPAWSEPGDQDALLERAKELHASMLTLDSHLDTPAVMQRPGFDITQRHSWEEDWSQVDFPRMREGGMDGGFLVVFVPQGPRTPEGRADAVKLARSRFDTIEAMLEKHGAEAGLARSPNEVDYLRRQGKLAFLIGIENGHAIGNDLDVLREFHRRGARYFGLTHTGHNDIGDASTGKPGEEHRGLSHFGRAAVELCNDLGVMVDVSHASDAVAHEVLRLSAAPVIASHSGAAAVYPHARNLSDSLIRGIAASGGVVQVNMFSTYLEDLPPSRERTEAIKEWRATYRDNWNDLDDEAKTASVKARLQIEKNFPLKLSDVGVAADHIDHVVKVAGIDHVGVSADFDGGGGVEGIMDISGMPRLTAELLRRGYTPEQLEKIWGRNLMRALAGTIGVAGRREMVKAPAPMIPLDSPEGQALLDGQGAADYLVLAANWVPQLKSHCGAASAVIVQNSLLPDAGLTQDNLFNEATSAIITQDTVYNIGFTLDELTRTITARSGLSAERFHAGTGADDHGYDAWIEALKAKRDAPDERLIVNYATGWLTKRKNSGGHFSPIAAYNEKENKVLVQEVNINRPAFWTDARELWDAMNQVDKVSGQTRGWIIVRRPQDAS